MTETTPSKKEIVGLVEAQAKTIESISERLVKSDLFVMLVELYSKTFVLTEESLSFIENGDRKLLVKEVTTSSDEIKLRKKLKNGLWLLTNFDSKRLCNFCFALAKELNLQLKIKIRPTKSRLENKLS